MGGAKFGMDAKRLCSAAAGCGEATASHDGCLDVDALCERIVPHARRRRGPPRTDAAGRDGLYGRATRWRCCAYEQGGCLQPDPWAPLSTPATEEAQ